MNGKNMKTKSDGGACYVSSNELGINSLSTFSSVFHVCLI